ncbi:hypothetical protein [Shewanella sp. AS16]|uniref:hypothetical protein n=1 Tax=Shewanella sp. AS16 TaxID=2907625 RepID=UPI003FA35AE2
MMHNIALLVNIEGRINRVETDWLAISAVLSKRELTRDELQALHEELCAGLRVTTRGLTLAKQDFGMANARSMPGLNRVGIGLGR